MKKHRILIFLFLFAAQYATAQRSYAEEMATTAMRLWKDSFTLEGDKVAKWRYDQGVILKGIEGIWQRTGDGKWFDYIQKSMDFYVGEDGSIKGYKKDEYNIDHVNNGKLLLLLYAVTGKEKYRKGAAMLRAQLDTHPRTTEGGFWHKKIYPSQMWLDGLYMGQPFYAEYAQMFGEEASFNDITRQFVLMEKHARDTKSGLLYHGWDESRQQKWANKTTGLSPHVWGRALGWYGMAMVDVLDHFPQQHPGRDSIIRILNRFAKAVVSVQDAGSGLWYDIPNLASRAGNYAEASASSMLVYTLAKGVRKGYLPSSFLPPAKRGYAGIIKKFIRHEGNATDLHGTVAVSGLGGNPYRDGSFGYYISEPVIVNDPKGIGAFINAANEMELLSVASAAKGQKVVLDYFFNNERKKEGSDRMVRWHYTWEDKSNGGFQFLGNMYTRMGAQLARLETAPSAAALKGANVYIITDPDTDKESEKPNRMTEGFATVISEWVRSGGTLVLLGNDAGNNDLEGFNILTTRFGVRFNKDNYNQVEGSKFEQGAVNVPANHSIFSSANKLYIKELATLDVRAPAKTVLQKEGRNIMAVAAYGKGKVFVLGDPWLYNEYVDGRKLPTDFNNFKAAEDLVRWTLRKTNAK